MTARPAGRRQPAEVAAAVGAWLRRRDGYGAAVISALSRPAGAGLSNETWLFDCSTPRGAESLVLQVGPAGQGLFRDYDLAVMARVQQQLGTVSRVPVPVIRWFEPDAAILGAPFYVMNRVRGQVPGDNPTYHQGGWFAELPAASRARAWRSGIAALAALHALEPLREGFEFLTTAPWGMAVDADPVTVRLAQWRDFMRWGARAPLPPIDAALTALEAARPAAQAPRIAWGDAKISNCVIEDDEVRALLDWELCGLSDPEEDLAFWLLLDWVHWHLPRVPRLAGLPTPAETVAWYETCRGSATRAVLWWFKFGLVRLAIIYHRFIERRIEMGRLPGDVDLLAANPVCALLNDVLALEKLP